MTIPPDPHDILRTTTVACQLHPRHSPHPHVNHWHHVWPRGEGGPDIPENRIAVCPTGHYNIHQLIKLLKAERAQLPYSVLRTFSFEERHYAQLGYERITRGQM
jgi:hypothetical protein